MAKRGTHITVFEHDTLRLGQQVNGVSFDASMLKALQRYYGEQGVPYFTLLHNGVRFNEQVGVIQVGNTLIEVLPKANRADDSKTKWRNLLIGMLKAVDAFDIQSTSNSNLKIKPNTILDLYFELFINELEYLLHQGLIKQYRRKEGNVIALKGSLLFGRHIQHNLTHQERFYVRHSTYDVQHLMHCILYKAICLLQQINTHAGLHSRIGALLLHFPEMPDIKVNPAMFEKLVFNRKNQSYQKVINIAKHILLQYHPDVSRGRNHVLALMFDMNTLWEKFVYSSLRRYKPEGITVAEQVSASFWKPHGGHSQKMRPDIVINKGHETGCIVLDTKWKNLGGRRPSPEDLRQMYAYHEFFGAKKVALVYPGAVTQHNSGLFHPTAAYPAMNKECSILIIAIPGESDIKKSSIHHWQQQIQQQLTAWLDETINQV
ncbi:McrC family protein [Niabella hibiscisoli]|uniref:McrC family protein n=1 Tax=Niabella hibiscisoli TaxID=1825928 RepID=UPI001F110C7E|nr:McrC family protein [Niabella hibiscisoli]MCH5719880.1 McrC family protein [Niabella hibiscisoli]